MAEDMPAVGAIDLHAHALPVAYLSALDELGISTEAEDGFPQPTWSAADHLAFMDAAGIDLALLSISSPHPHRGDDALAARQARSINDELGAICAAHPTRFAFAACLPLPAVAASVAEAVRALDDLGARAVKVPSNANGVYLGDARLASLYDELDRRDAVVLIHPTAPAGPAPATFTSQVKPMYEFLADTTRTVIDLVFSGTVERWPHIRWVVPHCGSFLPEVAHRMVGINKILAPRGMVPEVDVLANIRHLWFDIAGDAQPVMLDALLKVADPVHLLYGSDYPYTPAPRAAANKDSLAADPLLAGMASDVFHDNAARLLGL